MRPPLAPGRPPGRFDTNRERCRATSGVSGTSRSRSTTAGAPELSRADRIPLGGHVDIVVKGRNVEVPDHFRTHVADKLARSERYDPKIIRVDVELSHETNRRQSKNRQRVQITLAAKGPPSVPRRPPSPSMRRSTAPSASSNPGCGGPPTADTTASTPGRRSTRSPPPPTCWSRRQRPTRRCHRPPPNRAPNRPTRHAGRTTSGGPRTGSPVGSCGSRTIRVTRSRSSRPFSRWNWSATTSICSRTRTPGCARWSTGARAFDYGLLRLVPESGSAGGAAVRTDGRAG